MIRKYNSILIVLLPILILLIGCIDNEQNIPPPPPQLFDGHLCDTFKSRVREKLYVDGITYIAFDDTFSKYTWGEKRYYLDSILKYYFQMPHMPIFNDNYKNCIQPIMDSAIAAKYGVNAKDSIINEAYRLTDIVYKKENKDR